MMHLVRMRQRGIPKILTQFMPPDFKIETIQAEVTAANSPHQGRHNSCLPSTNCRKYYVCYVMAFGNQVLRKNQRHIGEYNVIMMTTLSSAALEVTIRDSCQLPVNVQNTTRKHYQDIVTLMQESGLHCSVSKDIALKTDITNFLQCPVSTLNHYLNRHLAMTFKPIKLDRDTIRSLGSKASRLYGYAVQDVGTITLGNE